MSVAQRLAVEDRIKSVLSKAGPDLAELRVIYDELCDVAPLPEGRRFEGAVLGGVRVEVGVSDGASSDAAILYLHGGGHMVGSLASHRSLVAGLGAAAGMRTIAVDFRLAPEHPYPAALDDAFAVYSALLAVGTPASGIALAGDSAGAGLALSLMLRAREAGLALPAAAVLFSPFVDFTGGSPSVDEDRHDVLVTPESVHATRAVYAPQQDAASPLISPLFGELRGLPPLLVHVGGGERLLDDAIRLLRKAGTTGVPVELKVWPDQPHVWQIFAGMLDEGRESIREAGAFLARTLGVEAR